VSNGGISFRNLIVLVVIASAVYFAWTEGLFKIFTRSHTQHSDVIVYVSNRCGMPCNRLVDVIRKENVLFHVLNVDDDVEIAQELREKLDAIGFRQTIYRLPVVDLYGEILPVPSIRDVKQRLR
jgi:hypothetical protein